MHRIPHKLKSLPAEWPALPFAEEGLDVQTCVEVTGKTEDKRAGFIKTIVNTASKS
jgi:hypothetical protein